MRRDDDVAVLAEQRPGVGADLPRRHRVEVEDGPALPRRGAEEAVVDEVGLRGELLAGPESEGDTRRQLPVEEQVLRRQDELPDAEVEGLIAGLGAVGEVHRGIRRTVEVHVMAAAAHLDLHAMDRHVARARHLQVRTLGELRVARHGDGPDVDLTSMAATRPMHVGALERRVREGDGCGECDDDEGSEAGVVAGAHACGFTQVPCRGIGSFPCVNRQRRGAQPHGARAGAWPIPPGRGRLRVVPHPQCT